MVIAKERSKLGKNNTGTRGFRSVFLLQTVSDPLGAPDALRLEDVRSAGSGGPKEGRVHRIGPPTLLQTFAFTFALEQHHQDSFAIYSGRLISTAHYV